MNKFYPHLFSPIKVGKTVFKNRLFSAPTMMNNITPAGCPTDYMIGYYEAKAIGGCAQVTVGDTPVDEDHAPSIPRHLVLSEPNLPWLSELARAIRQHGAVASLELNHGGLTASPAITGNNPVGPLSFIREDGVPVTAMDEEMMKQVACNYARSAALIKKAGFDMCMIHGAHGWLLDQFLSPHFNRRNDHFGGSLQNRARFPIMVIDRVREAVGPYFLIEYRVGPELIEGGLPIDEVIAYVKMIEHRIDMVHVSAGLDTIGKYAVLTHPTAFLPNGCNVKFAEAVNKEVDIPVITVGAITTPELAEQVLSEGKADIVAMTRSLIADPDFANKAKNGRAHEIIPCLRCLDCLALMHEKNQFSCAVNPLTGREFRINVNIKPAKTARKVLVIGGGPAGMKAAATAAESGHKVTLVEKTGSLGGLLQFSDFDPLKIDLKRLKDHLISMVSKLGITLLTNTEATVDFIRAFEPDALILACGSKPAVPGIPGINNPQVKHASLAYGHSEDAGNKVVIIGGGLVGSETAIYLAEAGKSVSLIEMKNTIAADANWMHREGLRQALERNGISVYTGMRCEEISPAGVKVFASDKQYHFIPADSVFYATGMQPVSDLPDSLREFEIHYFAAVGDCNKGKNVSAAIFSAYHAAVDID